MPEKDSRELETQLCFAIYSASLAFTRAYRPHLNELNLTYPQYLVMQVLWQKDGLTIGQIGDQLFQDSGTVTPLVKRLEQADLVKRCRSQTDERMVHVMLTQKGSDMRKIGCGVQDSIKATVGDHFAGDREFLDKILELRNILLPDAV